MIRLFEKNADSFDNNGICVLNPSVCTVSEVAGGNYELHMEYPIDENGKYAMLTEERIIVAPVPPTHIPQITLPETKVWKTIRTADLYSKLPSYRRVPCPDDIKAVKQNPSAYAWNVSRQYNKGALCTYANKIYRAKQYNFAVTPGTTDNVWQYVTTVAGSGDTTEVVPGTVIETLEADVSIAKVADYNVTFMRARSLSGNTGYIERAKCEETTVIAEGTVVDAQDIIEQPFRIYQIYGDDETQTVTVEARHISYDFRGNALLVCKFVDADPMTAIAIMQGALVNLDDREIISDISGQTITDDWSGKNPVNALLDPGNGLVSKLGAKLIRNGKNYFILDNSSPRIGARLAYGVNLSGVNWTRNIDNVITRVMPRCDDGTGEFLYLTDLYVESDISSHYAYPRTEIMECDYKVGESYEKPDGTTETITEEIARTKMQEDARKRFDIDKVDAVEIGLEVNFLLIGDTEEYRQYRGLQNVSMYDLIAVKTGPTNMEATAQVTEYKYDSILRRFDFIKAGDITSFNRKVSGYRMMKRSITYDKLSTSLINRIKSMNA